MRTGRGQLSGHLQNLRSQYQTAFGQEGKSAVAKSPKKKITYTDFMFVYVKVDGGDEENRTPVRKFIHKRLSERSLRSTFPHIKVRKQTLMLGSFIVHGRLKALPAHVHH